MCLLLKNNLWTKVALEHLAPGWASLEDHLFTSFFKLSSSNFLPVNPLGLSDHCKHDSTASDLH